MDEKLTFGRFLSEKRKSRDVLLKDLAATTQVRGKAISPDLPDYIMEKDVVRTALRTAKQYNIDDEEWLEFIQKIKERNGDNK